MHAAPNSFSKVMIHVPSKCLNHSRHHQHTLKSGYKYIQHITSFQSDVENPDTHGGHFSICAFSGIHIEKMFHLKCSS